MLKYILTGILTIAIITAAATAWRRRQRNAAARLNAAAVLIRESQLDNVISREAAMDPGRIRPVLELSWKDDSKRAYLFDPVYPVKVGKDPAKNNVCIRKATVGSEHCLLEIYKGALTVQDLNSRNGTYIRRSGRRYKVDGRVYVKNGDRLEVGGLSMKIRLFMYDAAYI